MKEDEFAEINLVRDDIRVTLEHIGEGFFGDYNPENPDDAPLVRFCVDQMEDGLWMGVDSASYCTMIPTDTPREILDKIARKILDEVCEPILQGMSVKKICESLSWITAADEA